MMRQYLHHKEQHPDAVLFFRLGDFYEMFHNDAQEVAHLLGLALTKRNGIPMCGIPHHAVRRYVAQLLQHGRKIAICEQTQRSATGMFEREVVEIITPGLAAEEEYLQQDSNNFLLAMACLAQQLCEAYIDLSTGDFFLATIPFEHLLITIRSEIDRIAPREIIIQDSLLEEHPEVARLFRDSRRITVNRMPDWCFDIRGGHQHICSLLGVVNLKAFAVSEQQPALYSAGALLDYVEQNFRSLLSHVHQVNLRRNENYLSLDDSSQRSMELVANMHDGGRNFSLLEVLDHTLTPMGRRRIRHWILSPLIDLSHIRKRQREIARYYHDQPLLQKLRDILSKIPDLARLTGRVAMQRASPRDIALLRQALQHGLTAAQLIQMELPQQQALEEIIALLQRAFNETLPVRPEEGNLICPGFSSELDALRELRDQSSQLLTNYVLEEQHATGITSLKVRFSRAIGYYFEVTNRNANRVPKRFIRRQSMRNVERFTTERLAELEAQISGVSDRIGEMEQQIFTQIRDQIGGSSRVMMELCGRLARVDCLQSLSWAALRRGYICPEVDDGDEINIELGRHPVVEAYLPPNEFVPNSLMLSNQQRFGLITGPNMAGKSTFLRQTALITLMAQMGSFVPVQKARIGVVDAIFCRVGASDNLARGESTFLVEMSEVGYIMRQATSKSLVIMDEVGRGTVTRDGLAIARAVIEYTLEILKTRGLFATHFHQLSEISHSAMFNLSLTVHNDGKSVVFLRRVQPGICHDAYGVYVARLAGVPEAITQQAMTYLDQPVDEKSALLPHLAADQSATGAVDDTCSPEAVIGREIVALSSERLTPLEALNHIADWQRRLTVGTVPASPPAHSQPPSRADNSPQRHQNKEAHGHETSQGRFSFFPEE